MSTSNTFTLHIDGMTCSHCTVTVEKYLKSQNCEDVGVNLALEEATLTHKGKLDIDKLTRGLQQLGYSARIIRSAEEEKGGWSPIEKKFWLSVVFTVPLLLHMVMPKDSFLQNPILQFALCLPVFAVGLWHFGRSAWGGLRAGTMNMDVLITIGSTAAFGYSLYGTLLYYDTTLQHDFLFFETAASIITLVLLGNLLEHRSIRRTTTAIKDLTSLQVKTATRIIDNGDKETEVIPYDEIVVGNLLQVNSGERIPVDGVITEGQAIVDESMVTGESWPVTKTIGMPVVGSTILQDGNLVMQAEAVGRNTALSRIIDLVKGAQQQKPNIQRLGDKVSAVFVPVVLGIAAVTFLVAWLGFDIAPQQAMINAVAVLVISCPCAMGLAAPTAVMVGIGRAAKQGILIKGASTLEEFAKVNTIVFDKTGTLTTGQFRIKDVQLRADRPKDEILWIVLVLENHSSHPIAKSLVSELQETSTPYDISNAMEKKGYGMVGTDANGNVWAVGSHRLVEDKINAGEHHLYVLRNDELVATLDIQDEIKEGSKELIAELNAQGITTVMLSGDKTGKCKEVADKVGIQQVYAEQLPEQKLDIIKTLGMSRRIAMVGDGINDAPALSTASVGISFGSATEISMNSAQIVLLGISDMRRILDTLAISRATLKTIKQNFFWAFFYNVLAIPIAAFGFLSPIIASLSMAFSDIMVIGNSLRLKIKKIA